MDFSPTLVQDWRPLPERKHDKPLSLGLLRGLWITMLRPLFRRKIKRKLSALTIKAHHDGQVRRIEMWMGSPSIRRSSN